MRPRREALEGAERSAKTAEKKRFFGAGEVEIGAGKIVY
jgi:hypothetical protein